MGKGAVRANTLSDRLYIQEGHHPWTLRVEEEVSFRGAPHCRPGVLDNIARQVYLQGQTAFLALVIHDRTGGQIWGTLNKRNHQGVSPVPGHFAVETAPGMVADITGTRPLAEWENISGGRGIQLSREELRRWQKNHQPRKQWIGKTKSHKSQYHLAESFADLIL